MAISPVELLGRRPDVFSYRATVANVGFRGAADLCTSFAFAHSVIKDQLSATAPVAIYSKLSSHCCRYLKPAVTVADRNSCTTTAGSPYDVDVGYFETGNAASRHSAANRPPHLAS